MTTCFLAPDPIQSTQFIPGGAVPATGGQLFFYAAGSATKQTVYKDNAAAVAWSNPIVLDSGGNLPLGGVVWFPTGQTFKVVFAPSNDTDPPASPYWSKDNLSGINDVTAGSPSEWITGPTPTFISATSFSVVGDQTSILTNGRRIKSTNTGGTVYSRITNVSFSVGVTTVSVTNDSGSLDSGLSAIFYGLLDAANPSIDFYHIGKKGTAVASAGNGTTNVWGTAGNYLHITGTNTIFNFSSASYAGAAVTVVFDGILAINSSAAITIPGGNVTTAANDTAMIVADTTSTAVIVRYQTASGLPNVQQASSTVLAGPISGASNVPSFRALTASDGAPEVLIQSVNVTSAVSSVAFTTSINSAYDTYLVRGVGVIPSSSNVDFQMSMSINTGASFDTGVGSYAAARTVLGTNTTTYSAASASTAAIGFAGSPNTISNSGLGSGIDFSVECYRLSVPGVFKKAKLLAAYAGITVPADVTGIGVGQSSTLINAAVNALNFQFASGNISTGVFRLYGRRGA